MLVLDLLVATDPFLMAAASVGSTSAIDDSCIIAFTWLIASDCSLMFGLKGSRCSIIAFKMIHAL